MGYFKRIFRLRKIFNALFFLAAFLHKKIIIGGTLIILNRS
jgi:hypothetical protein